MLGPEDLRRTERIDAMVGGVGLGLDLAEELGQLAPFGMGNPGVRLMVPSARVSDVRTMGEGKHARFSLHSGAHRALGVAFGRSSLGVEDDDAVDAAVRLEVNHWNGSVEPRVVLRELYPLEDDPGGAGPAAARCDCEEGEWWQRFEAELGRALGTVEPALADLSPSGPQSRGDGRRTVVDGGRRRSPWRSPSWSPAAPACSRSAPTPHAGRRWPAAPPAWPASTAAPPGSPAIAAGAGRPAALAARADGGLALTDYATLAREPRARRALRARRPRRPAARTGPTRDAATGPGAPASRASCTGSGPRPSRAFAVSASDEQQASRAVVAGVFRRLREAGEASGTELR